MVAAKPPISKARLRQFKDANRSPFSRGVSFIRVFEWINEISRQEARDVIQFFENSALLRNTGQTIVR